MIIAGTGHRPNKLGGYSQTVFSKLVELAEQNILDATRVISGMALGWDLALAQAAVNKKISLFAAVPFKGQETIWPAESQKLYKTLLEKADGVEYICQPGYAPWKMQARNVWMVEQCTLLLALWDGTDGGTANCVKYALKQGKPIKNIWNDYESP